MRQGRLQASTLANIWRSLDSSNDTPSPASKDKVPLNTLDPLQKQYIPQTADSPLFRLISVSTSSEELGVAECTPQARSSQSTTIHRASSENLTSGRPGSPAQIRGFSVPNITSTSVDILNPRVVQSTSNLYASPNFIEAIPVPERPGAPEPIERENPDPVFGAILNQPSQASITRSVSFTSNVAKSKSTDWKEEYAHIDIDWSMQAMDVLYNAAFYDYIRDERNVDLSAIRLSRIIKDYKPRQVANALLWMIQGWSVETTAKLLRIIFSDWLPDLAGCVFSLISRNWPKTPQCSLCVAYLLMSEPANTSALFLRSLMQNWSRKESIDLVTYLDAILKWNTEYLQEVMAVYANPILPALPELPQPNEVKEKVEKFKSSIEETSHKLMLANARLAVAEYQLALFTHWSSCTNCQAKEECAILSKLTIPNFNTSQTDLGLDQLSNYSESDCESAWTSQLLDTSNLDRDDSESE
ncbi:hypothetical protein HK103_003937 [Boothiomyces macroporosus]|uniref:Uncharacterized protein n=1 Tax=Boothiomyces macroporosus TaxID=261099 RepID=A0AAD5YB68_9FUNG|nr:hypothetical protein HK103_003937 [Boothiomyces macroporosus]